MWKAYFKDTSVIDEIEMLNGKEVLHSFSEVLKNIENLESLAIVQGSKMFTVRMSDGRFTCNTSGIEHSFFAMGLEIVRSGKLENIRPIYFVRETVNFSENSGHMTKSSLPLIDFTALGLQANIDGMNIKRYLAILPDGTYYIEDK